MFVLSKSLSPAPLPSKYYHFFSLSTLLVVCALSKERKWNKFQKKNKSSPSNREKKKKKKVDVNEKKTEDTSSRHRLFSIY